MRRTRREDGIYDLAKELGYEVKQKVHGGFFNQEYPWGLKDKKTGRVHCFQTLTRVRNFLKEQKKAAAWGFRS